MHYAINTFLFYRYGVVLFGGIDGFSRKVSVHMEIVL